MSEKSETTCFVANLPFNIDSAALRNMFDKAVDARVSTLSGGRSKGYGYVEFVNGADRQNAIATMDGKAVDGRALVVKATTTSEFSDAPQKMSAAASNSEPTDAHVEPWTGGNHEPAGMLGPSISDNVVREPPDTFVATVFKQGPNQCPGGVLGPHFLPPAEQSEKNWNDRVQMAKQFLASKPQHGTKVHADYDPGIVRIYCDNCGLCCTDSHWHCKIQKTRLADLCDGCMRAFRFLQFPLLPLCYDVCRLYDVVNIHQNDKEISEMNIEMVAVLAEKQFQARRAALDKSEDEKGQV
jgi:hypothetical protein